MSVEKCGKSNKMKYLKYQAGGDIQGQIEDLDQAKYLTLRCVSVST